TNRCPLSCVHCFYSARLNTELPDELTLAEFECVADSFRRPLESITFTGGEPIFRPDFPQVAAAFHRRARLRAGTVPTSGVDPDRMVETIREVLRRTKSLEVSTQVSVDGREETHERIRKIPGLYAKALETVERLLKLRREEPRMGPVMIITTVMAQNLDDVVPLRDEMRRLLPEANHKFQIVRGAHAFTYGVAPAWLSNLDPGAYDEALPEPARLREVVRALTETPRDKTLLERMEAMNLGYCMRIVETGDAIMPCVAGWFDGVLYPTGEVAMCENTRAFANVRDHGYDFARLWRSEVADTARGAIAGCHCIHPCNVGTSMSFHGETLAALAAKEFPGVV
ncbi:MAG: radical SAM protein, partial [Candidatus Methylomirabilis sp.]|nr:radical SAM protein [Deltaproteobacteria bacterium]